MELLTNRSPRKRTSRCSFVSSTVTLWLMGGYSISKVDESPTQTDSRCFVPVTRTLRIVKTERPRNRTIAREGKLLERFLHSRRVLRRVPCYTTRPSIFNWPGLWMTARRFPTSCKSKFRVQCFNVGLGSRSLVIGRSTPRSVLSRIRIRSVTPDDDGSSGNLFPSPTQFDDDRDGDLPRRILN